MILKASIFGLFLCVVVEGGKAISEQKIVIHAGHHSDLKHVGDKKPEHHDEYAWTYPSYEFSYKVKDPHTHDEKGQHEARHNDEVRGEYWLIEPDGHKRTVRYRAEKHTGFHAIVKYSGPLHHIRHKSKDEHKKHDEELGQEEGEEIRREGDEQRGGDEIDGGNANRGGDEVREGDDEPGGDEVDEGNENRSGEEGGEGEDEPGGDEVDEGNENRSGNVESNDENGETREAEETQGNEKDDFWSFLSLGKKDKKKEWAGKMEEHRHKQQKNYEKENIREEGEEQDGKHGGLFGYHWGRKYDSSREREEGQEEGRRGEEKGREGDDKGRNDDNGRDGDDKSRDGDNKGRNTDDKRHRKGGRKGGRRNDRGRGREEGQGQEGSGSNDEKRGVRGGEGKGQGNNKGRDREGLSSYQIPMPYPKRTLENYNARTYSHGRIYRTAPAHRQ